MSASSLQDFALFSYRDEDSLNICATSSCSISAQKSVLFNHFSAVMEWQWLHLNTHDSQSVIDLWEQGDEEHNQTSV